MEQALSLQESIDAYLDDVRDRYDGFRGPLEIETIDCVRRKIASAKSSNELKSILDNDVAGRMSDVRVRLEAHLKGVERNAKSNSSSLLFHLFRDMYIERRKAWLVNLYRNPILVIHLMGLVFTFFFRMTLAIRDLLPAFFGILSFWWFPVVLGASGLVILSLQYVLLNPKRQFVPPSFSLLGIHRLVKSNSDRVEMTVTEAATGGAVVGALIGTFAVPGAGTLVGGLIGSLIGLTGKRLERQKDKISQELCTEISGMFHQLDSVIYAWIDQSKESIARAALDSFKQNLSSVSGYLTARTPEVKQLTAGD